VGNCTVPFSCMGLHAAPLGAHSSGSFRNLFFDKLYFGSHVVSSPCRGREAATKASVRLVPPSPAPFTQVVAKFWSDLLSSKVLSTAFQAFLEPSCSELLATFFRNNRSELKSPSKFVPAVALGEYMSVNVIGSAATSRIVAVNAVESHTAQSSASELLPMFRDMEAVTGTNNDYFTEVFRSRVKAMVVILHSACDLKTEAAPRHHTGTSALVMSRDV
jgi:hypothetical protein